MASDAPTAALPSLSAAEALSEAPLCKSLTAVELARLVPELEELEASPGQAIYSQGDPPDGLYLIRSGTAEVTILTDQGRQHVNAIEAPACFGDVEVLTGEPRLADVVARTPLSVWRLPRERFESLLAERPLLPREIAGKLAGQLAQRTRDLTASQEQTTAAARAAYASLDPVAQHHLRRAALFDVLDERLLRDLLGGSWSAEAFATAVEHAVFLVPDGDRLHFSTLAAREFLLDQLRAEVGDRALRSWRRRAADLFLRRLEEHEPNGDLPQALDLLCAAEDWRRLADLLEARGSAIAEDEPEDVEGHLRALPERHLWSRPALVRLLATCCVAQGKLEQAVDAYVHAQERNGTLRKGGLAVTVQQELARLYSQLGQHERHRECLAALRHLEVTAGHEAQQSAEPLSTGEHTPWRHDVLAALAGACGEQAFSWRWIGTLVVLALAAAAWGWTPPAGLSDGAFHVLVTMAALIALSFLDVLPDYLLGLLMIAAWVVTGTVPSNVAAAGFANPSWFLLLAAMAVGTAVERSGLLYRGAIGLVRSLPQSHAVRCLTLAGLGFLSALAIPSAPGRVMLAMPVAQDIAESLRQRPNSGGSASLALATFVGFGMFGSLFLTGNPMGLIIYGLFPPDVKEHMSWGMWFLAALPTHLLLFGLAVGFILFWYRPEDKESPPAETLVLQQRVLGPIRRDEWIVGAVLLLLVIGFSTQALHGINPAWIAMAAAATLFIAGALDDATFKQGTNVSFLLYLGVVLGLGDIFAHVKLDEWLAGMVGDVPALARGSQTLFILLVAGLTALSAILLRSGPVSILLALALYGPAGSLGIDPWVVAITVLLTMNLWVYPQQNTLYLTAYYGSGEHAFSHAQARPLALLYVVFVFAALVASIPYWRWLGLM
jgi:di/tricarboxylate transporter/CRP-like cAMP-binding protein